MPLINFDIYDNLTKEQVKILADSVHKAVLEAFGVPERDRYQVIRRHAADEMILLDTGLGFERDEHKAIVIQVVSSPRTVEAKQEFYRLVAKYVEENLNIDSKNILISIVENTKADWSFGYGEAQFLTGKL